MPEYANVEYFNKQLNFTKPSYHLIILGLVLLWVFNLTQSSAQDLNSFDHGDGFNRYFEQIPLSIFVGYLLFRTFNVVMKSDGNKEKANLPTMLMMLGGVLLAGYVLMNEISYFAGDDEEEAKKRRQKITQVGLQSLAFGAVFVFISHKSPKRRSTNIGNKRFWANFLGLLVVGLCMFANDIKGVIKVHDTDHHWTKDLGRWVKLVVTAVFVVMAMVNEYKIWDNVDGFHLANDRFGGLGTLDSAAYAGPADDGGFGYEI